MLKPIKKNPWSFNPSAVKKAKEDQAKMLAAMSIKAREILSDEKFANYKEMFDLMLANEVDSIIYLDEDDPIKYAFKVKEAVATIKAYRLLISSVEEDAKRQVQEEPK